MENNRLQKIVEVLGQLTEEKRKEKNRLEEERKNLIVSVGKEIADSLSPTLEKIANQSKLNKKDIEEALGNIKLSPNINIPPVEIPDIKVPVPQVNYTPPTIKIPDIKMPEEMDIRGWVQLQGVDLSHPLPVQLRDKDGKPVNLLENLTTIIGGGGGGKSDFFTIKGFNQSAYSELQNADGRLRVSVETGGSGLTDNELRAVAVPVSQVSGARWSTEATQGTSPWVVSATDLDVRDLVNASDSVSVYQVSGANWSVYATGFGASVSASLLNGDGNSLDPRDRNWTISETVAVSGALDTVKSSGIARQTNPTAVSDGDNQRISLDDLGRQLVRPVQVRDLIATAYVAKATGSTFGTETTLLASGTGVLLDLIYVMGTNDSTAAIQVDLRASTGGNIAKTIEVPAGGTAGITLAIPYPAPFADHTWTIDLPDVTGTNVTITAMFSKEV
mgnify:FL=1